MIKVSWKVAVRYTESCQLQAEQLGENMIQSLAKGKERDLDKKAIIHHPKPTVK